MHRTVTALLLVVSLVPAAEHQGVVQFGGLPVPGATITAKRANETATAVSNAQGAYSFGNLADGAWQLRVEMPGFAPIEREVAIAAGAPQAQWELQMLPFEGMQAKAIPPPAPAVAKAPATAKGKASARNEPPGRTQQFQRADLNTANSPPAALANNDGSANQDVAELNQRAADGFLINGSANNGASSPFALGPAFGNNRRGIRNLYSGNFGVTADSSALDARPFSLTGQDTARPAYNNFTGFASVGGPLKIPHLIRNGPNVFVAYQWMRNRADRTLTGLVPTPEERNGDLSAIGGPVLAPTEISPQAQALLKLYPLPNFGGAGRYNYQIASVFATHQDNLQSRFNKLIDRKNQLAGSFGLQSTRTDTPNLFGFLDTGSTLGSNAQVNWRHTFGQRLFANFGLQFSRMAARVSPYFANRENISGQAGISGNNQEPVNWGPPNLNFAGGISSLSDAPFSFNRNQTSGVSIEMLWSHGRHNVSFGSDYRRQQYNYLAQQDARGTFTFTGAAVGSDLAGFLSGIPDISSIAFGNADKYFRATAYDAFIQDDWRMSAAFTLNAGVRWEYGSPITEIYGRLVNLDIAPGYTAVAPVVANHPAGTLTGQRYPDSLVHPDRHGIQPRIGISWRPLPASSMVVRAGYGVYYNTSVYQNIALQMAQQWPLSKSVNGQSTPGNPLSLANGFNGSPGITPDSFALDPNFRVGYSQNWSLSVQRDLPGALVATVTYVGTKGTRGMQEFLPNTYPLGAVNPCPSCPAGFYYLTSNGNSTRESGQIQLRRRLHNGLTASLQYTFAKAIDDSALGGRGQAASVIAQNWLDLAAERGLSSFDQRHLLTAQVQYTTGMGVAGGTLVEGWRGALFKEWTLGTQVTAGSGFPLTPVYPLAVRNTAVSGPVRPNYTGASVSAAPPGLFLNPLAYAPPAAGQWGNAGRNSITGPSQFLLNATLARTFRMSDRLNADLQINAQNALNHVTFPSWNTTLGNLQFGLPMTANSMRIVQTTLRVRF